MKQLISILLLCALLVGCSAPLAQENSSEIISEVSSDSEGSVDGENDVSKNLRTLEAEVYSDLLVQLGSTEYFVENVEAVYISKEYIEEVEYNSKANVYFGYTLAELDEAFNGTRFVFSLGEDGKTTVKEFEKYDDSYEQVFRNILIGSGVILVCVTVSVVSGGAGASAISLVFASAAKGGAIAAVSGGVISGVSAGVVEGIKTKDFDSAMKAAALAGSEGYKWGAIGGTLEGGVSGLRQVQQLKGALSNGLTLDEAAKIQMETKWSPDTIKQIKSMDEYNVYKEAGLFELDVDGQMLLVNKELDLDFVSEYGGKKVTNLERMKAGGSPVDADGVPFELHHIGQKNDGTLAMLTAGEHRENAGILNIAGKESEVDHSEFNNIRKNLYKELADILG